MKFEITLGWWLLPVAVTIAAFGWHHWVHRNEGTAHDLGRIGAALGEALTLAVALIVTLIAWLIWALFMR